MGEITIEPGLLAIRLSMQADISYNPVYTNCQGQLGQMDEQQVITGCNEKTRVCAVVYRPAGRKTLLDRGLLAVLIIVTTTAELRLTDSHTDTISIRDSMDSRHTSESEPSKAQLLEALCHSQTRAREAEKAAQKAYSEKEHVVKLLFKQASHLFAYKQWLHLLQLETLILQLKTDHQRLTDFFPTLPWMPLKARQLRKGVPQVTRRNKSGIGRYAVALAVGLGLAGAGLLLGWTMGWILNRKEV
ncbi:hypothetical protein ACLOJK_010314 [Asimina triloba]